MAPLRPFGLADLLSLLLVLAVAAGLRVGYLVACCDKANTSGPLRVQEPPRKPAGSEREDELEQLIRNVRDSRSFSCGAPFAGKQEGGAADREEPTAHVAPAFPWLVGNFAKFVNEKSLDSLVRWIQALLGTLTAMLYFFFARRAFRSLRVGLVAGLMTAANPFWIISTGTLDDATLASFALGGCLFLSGQAGEKGGPLNSLMLGLALGGLGLVRAALLPFAFVGLVWFLIRGRALPNSWLCGLLSFLGFLTALAPWTVRNYKTFGEPVPVVSSTYLHLWIGNNPTATGGPWAEDKMQPARPEELPKAKNQQARYSQLGKEVVAEVREKPGATLRRRLHAAIAFFVGDDWLSKGELARQTSATLATPAEPKEGEPKVSEPKKSLSDRLVEGQSFLLHFALVGMLSLAILGWRWSFVWRWESIPAMLAMVWVPLPYVLGHAEALSGPRLPLDGVILCFAAFGLVGLMPGLNAGLLDRREDPHATQEQRQF